MDERNYTKRETDEWRRDIKETLDRIEVQTLRTNGRVSKLERWQQYVFGFCACLSLLMVPMLLRLLIS